MNKILLMTFFFALKLSSLLGQSDWKLKTEKEGIKIYTRQIVDSRIKAIKVESVFDATTSQLVALIMDVNSSPDWVYHIKSCTLVKRVSASELYYYSEVSLPWPAADRDFVAHLTVTQNPDTKIVTIDGPAVQGFVPEKKGTVRVNDSKGKWVITPMGADQIKVEYTIHVDPGGDLPSWLVNMFATEGPLKIFRNIKSQLQKPAYKNSYFALAQ
jgi:hypothetical protein